ncbi:hypothetical protein GWN42_19415 [candidate division KSB1 bacterium]|nr:hypothetical protein [candidate division KSB1 bacterium]
MKRTTLVVLTMALLLSLGTTWAQSGRKAMSSDPQRSDAVTLKGEIINVLLPLAKFKTEDKEYTVHLGPIWYWQQEKLELKKGKVEMVGEQEEVDGTWHIYPNKISQGQSTIELVSEKGVPKWAAARSTRQGGKWSGRRGGAHHRCGHHRCGDCCGRW